MTTTPNNLIHVTYAGTVLLGKNKHYAEGRRSADRLAIAERLVPVLTAMHGLGVLGDENTYRLVLGEEVRPLRTDPTVLPKYLGVAGRLRSLQDALRKTIPGEVLVHLPDVAILTGGQLGRLATLGMFLHDGEQHLWDYNSHDYV